MGEMEHVLGRRARKKREVERRIRETALRLFRERGYEETTVEEIAEAADVAKGTFFNYFARKDALLEALARDIADSLLEELGPVEGWSGTAREQMTRLYLTLGGAVARDRELSKVMIVENLRSLWMRPESDPLQVEFQELVCAVLAGGVERGELAETTPVPVAGRLLEAAYVTTVIEFLRSGHGAAWYRQELTEKLDIIFRGLSAGRPGAKGEAK